MKTIQVTIPVLLTVELTEPDSALAESLLREILGVRPWAIMIDTGRGKLAGKIRLPKPAKPAKSAEALRK